MGAAFSGQPVHAARGAFHRINDFDVERLPYIRYDLHHARASQNDRGYVIFALRFHGFRFDDRPRLTRIFLQFQYGNF